MNKEFKQWLYNEGFLATHSFINKMYSYLQANPHLLREDRDNHLREGQIGTDRKRPPIPLFRGRRIDTGMWMTGQYVTTPITDENSGLPSESGWFFLTGETRHCIVKDGVAYSVVPESVTVITV